MALRAAFAASLLLVTACSSSAQQAKTPGPSDVVATVGTSTVKLAEVDDRALRQPAGNFGNLLLGQALYEARRSALDEIIGEILIDREAKLREMNRTKLTDEEVTSKITTVTDSDVAAWYQANQGRVQGAPLEQVRGPIRSLLTQERSQDAYGAYVDRLKAKTPVRIQLDPPRQKVAAADSPAKGPSNAPIELIEFSDFQCPFCLRAHPIVSQVLSTYGNKIRFVYRNYPLPNHPNARPAAEAAQCAHEQGQFWPYYDRLFANPTKLADGDLKQAAAELGLDANRFNSCFDSHKFKGVVDTDVKEGSAAGVNGTPAFFINGRLINGAQPFDAFKRVIDDELELKRQK